MFDPVYASAGETAQAIREGRISAVETLEAHLDRIARLNGAIHAVVTLDEEGARRRAREADAALARGEIWGALHGVPITIFDHIETASIRSTEGGNPKYADHIPVRDAVVVARLRGAGATIIGKTNDDHGFWGEDALFPPPNNPWDVSRIMGGAGGPVAAVAAGFTPLEIGPDAGSVQVPAAFSGVYALRPTEHRVPFADIFFSEPFYAFRHVVSMAPVARSIGDLRLALEVVAGADLADSEIAPVPLGEFAAPPLTELRIAWASSLPGIPMDHEIAAAIEAFAGKLEAHGVQMENRLPDIDFVELLRNLEQLYQLTVGALEESRGEKSGPSLAAYLSALHRRDLMNGVWERFIGEWDGLLLPITTLVALRRDATERVINGVALSAEEVELSRLPSRIAPATGLPTVVMPLGRTHEGLPFGVQLLGRRWDEMRLLAIAEQVASLTDGFVPPPGY